MRILIIMTSYKWFRSLRIELLDALIASGSKVSIVGPFDGAQEDLIKRNCDCIHLDVQRRGTNILVDAKFLLDCCRIIKNLMPDLVLTFSIKANIYGSLAASMLSVPFIASITGLGSGLQNPGLLQKLLVLMYRKALSKARCVFFQNDANFQFMLQCGVINQNHHIRIVKGSGVNLTHFTLQPYPDSSAGIRLLFIGRLMRDKGIGELLAAFEILSREFQSLRLDMIGEVEEESANQLLNNHSHLSIIYHGEQLDVRPYLAACHCLVLPSYHEGMANVLLEAAASGRPVIASRIPGCQEAFDEGISGLGCNPRSTDSLAQTIRDFLSLSQMERTQMGFAGRAKMEREFDRNHVVESYMQEIKKDWKGIERL